MFPVSTFNERVVREAVLNAVSHRNYQMAGSIFVRQYPERLVVESPGGFPSGITLDNILDRQSPRNRRIAEILALSGFIERSGQGMNLMYELSVKEAKSLPDFSGTDAYWVFITLNGLVLNEKMVSLMKKVDNKHLESLSAIDFHIINTLLHKRKLPANLRVHTKRLVDMGIIDLSDNVNDNNVSDNVTDRTSKNVSVKKRDVRQANILESLKKNSTITVGKLAAMFKVSERTILRDLETLRNQKRIDRVGSDAKGHWRVIDKFTDKKNQG